ncbi:hypothetical protein DL95DRAFT_462971 [Leptodontidium sp. 2 PMI_412]|nr:hypothetical protein BKA61DRAFT_681662 [Leptodontidium sp. MPI-SDFR-AT-0119]KAH9213492.1 hypothetical protein DL95DRAFT_462971 [Leptodontidium sp. 2 PMI_412]
MAIYHVVLFKLKPGVTPEQISEYKAVGRGLVGKIPGLLKFEVNTALPATAHRAQGYDMGVILVLGKEEDLKVYTEHPAHLGARKLRLALSDDTLAFDMEVA